METDGSGNFTITNLPPGIYDIVVEIEYSRVELTVDQVQNLNATLSPSPAYEKVTVRGEQLAPIDLNDAQIANVVRGQQLESLPLILRDPYQLTLLSPGAIQSNSLLGGFSVNGSRERNNNFLLDGTDNNDADSPGLSLPQPGLARFRSVGADRRQPEFPPKFVRSCRRASQLGLRCAAEVGAQLYVGSSARHGSSILERGPLRRIVASWQLAGISTFSSGLPYDIFTDLDTAHTGEAQRPNYNPAGTLLPVSDPGTQTGPNLGLFNRVQFCQPDNMTADTGTFGQSTCEVRRPDQTSGARQIQFGLKLRF